MVSTRQMSNVGGSNSSNDGAGPSYTEPASIPRVTRHSSGLLPSASLSGCSQVQHSYPGTSKCPSPQRVQKTEVQFLDLPVEIIEKIFRYVGYKNISQMRLVNRQFNTLSSSLLNSTFLKLQNQMLIRFQAIKAKMPRRESARRSHPLACESDIIETLHMRLSLLQMTFGKHIERKHCCFFPGEILDEVYNILSYLKVTTKLPRPYKITDELFDLTAMAMEYFKEHIEPNLPEITYFGTEFFDITTVFSPGESSKSYMCLDSPPPGGFESSAAAAPSRELAAHNYLEESLPPSPPPPPPQSNMVLRKRIHRIKQGMKKYNDQLSELRSDLRGCKRKTALQQKQISEQQKQIAEQQKQTMEYANRLDDYDKKNEETSRKFQTLLQELNKCKTELQYWRSRSPAVPPLCAECGAALNFSSPHYLLQWNAGSSAETVELNEASGSAESAAPVAVAAPEPAAPAVALTALPAAAASAVAVAVAPDRGPGPGPVAAAEPRRLSADATPERKKRRLTRPRKL